ncbi:MAG TPA: protein Mom [Thermoanaerobaculia bacterium]|nr:protein Mom [Thermoanaerobaculia bacterium]
MSTLRLDFCSHEAARHAVMRWHYSRQMPKSKLVRIGVWEGERFCGVVIYGLGANRHLASPFGLAMTEVAELVRVALAPGRRHPTSKCVAISLKLLHRQSPGLKLVVSYADRGQGHVGTIYQAGGWLYLGASQQSYLRVKGTIEHPRTLYDRYGPQGQSIPWLRQHVDPRAERVPMAPKLKYVMPFDPTMRRKLEAVALPYPKNAAEVTPSDTPGFQPGEGGATPTRPLHAPAHA